jgi:hypothetical protein
VTDGPRRAHPPDADGSLVGVARYLTALDVSGKASDPGLVTHCLRQVPVERALDWVARMLAPSALSGPWRNHQRQLAQEWFFTAELSDVRAMVLSGSRQLLAPQVLLQLARSALLHCSRDPAGDHESAEQRRSHERNMRSAMLVMAEHLGARRRSEDDQLRGPDGVLTLGGAIVTGLELEVTANLLVNRRPDPASVFERSTRRWVEIPQEEKALVDLAGEFEAATGVRLEDLRMVALVLWASATGPNGPRVGVGHLDSLGLGPARTNAALGLLGAAVEELAAEAGAPGTDGDYEFSLFSRFPLVRLAAGGLLVISPILLAERALGWLPRWDLSHGFGQGKEGKKRADRAVTYLRHTTERHATETLEHLVDAGAATGMLHNPDAVQAAFGTKDPNADCAIDWPGCWVVAEISSRTVTQETAAALSADALLDDLNKGVITKARQLEGTIAALRSDEGRLTGRTANGPRHFWPLLVTTEGLPMNPVTTERVHGMLRSAGLLQHDDTGLLVVLDIEALEAAETVAERGGPNLPALLAEHAVSARPEPSGAHLRGRPSAGHCPPG